MIYNEAIYQQNRMLLFESYAVPAHVGHFQSVGKPPNPSGDASKAVSSALFGPIEQEM